jgi:hypothetical protein
VACSRTQRTHCAPRGALSNCHPGREFDTRGEGGGPKGGIRKFGCGNKGSSDAMKRAAGHNVVPSIIASQGVSVPGIQVLAVALVAQSARCSLQMHTSYAAAAAADTLLPCLCCCCSSCCSLGPASPKPNSPGTIYIFAQAALLLLLLLLLFSVVGCEQ